MAIGVEWRYLRSGKVKHALERADNHNALCGAGAVYIEASWAVWYGTGSQAEYETVERLPPCKLCVARMR